MADTRDPSAVEDMTEIGRYSLRFGSPRLEEAFNSSRHQTMCLNISRIAAIGSLPILQQFGAMVLYLYSGGVFRIQTHIYFVSLCLLLALCLLWGTVPRLQRFQQWVSFQALEGIAMFMGLVFLAHFMDLAYHAGSLFLDTGVELLPGSTEYHQKAMATAALGLDAVVTCWHLALPVRWFVIVWMDVLLIIAFAISSYMLRGLPPGDVEVHVILLFSCLVMGTSLGLRSAETHTRILFTTILDERTLRAKAEFEAELKMKLTYRRAPRGPKTVGTSSTTTFGDLTRRAGQGDSDALEDIVALGQKEQWVLDPDQVQVSEGAILGEGSFGTVVAGEFCSTPVAVKCCRAESRPGATHVVATMLNELSLLRRIRHPNVVVFCGVCFHSSDGGITYNEFRLVLEKVCGVTLRSHIRRLKVWNLDSPHSKDQVQIMKDVCRALIYIHSRRPCVVHGDLKPSNVMVESHVGGPFAKLLDFGLSQLATRNSTISGGTMNYMAGEQFQPNCAPRPPIDIFAAGRLLFFVASGREPKPSVGTADEGSGGSSSASISGPTNPLSWLPATSLLEAQRPLIERCCEEPDRRPTAREVYQELAARWSPSKDRPPAGLGRASAGATGPGHGSGARPCRIDEEHSAHSSPTSGSCGGALAVRRGDFHRLTTSLEAGDAATRSVEFTDSTATSSGWRRRPSGSSSGLPDSTRLDGSTDEGDSQAAAVTGEHDSQGGPGAERDARKGSPREAEQDEKVSRYLASIARAREEARGA